MCLKNGAPGEIRTPDHLVRRKSQGRQAAKKVEVAQQIERHNGELARLAAARRTFGDAIEQWGKLELSRRKDSGKKAMRAIPKDVIPVLNKVVLVDVKRGHVGGYSR